MRREVYRNNKKVLREFEEAKAKVDNGELRVAMLCVLNGARHGLKRCFTNPYTTNFEIDYYKEYPSDEIEILEIYPNIYDVSVYEKSLGLWVYRYYFTLSVKDEVTT